MRLLLLILTRSRSPLWDPGIHGVPHTLSCSQHTGKTHQGLGPLPAEKVHSLPSGLLAFGAPNDQGAVITFRLSRSPLCTLCTPGTLCPHCVLRSSRDPGPRIQQSLKLLGQKTQISEQVPGPFYFFLPLWLEDPSIFFFKLR